jgi:hypothetical protein
MRRVLAALAESDFAPIRFIAMFSVLCASGDSAPSDMPGVTNRLRISVIDSTSSIGSRLAQRLEIEQVAQLDRLPRPHRREYFFQRRIESPVSQADCSMDQLALPRRAFRPMRRAL